MTAHVMDLWREVIWVAGGIVALLVFGLALALPHMPRIIPGSRGHRPTEEETVHEEVRPDGYIDTFGREVEEAGGGLPPLMKIAVPAVLAWWLLYILFNWAPGPGG
jgi:hypothetical protein